MTRVIVLTDGVAGHDRTSAGILAALEHHHTLEARWIPMREKRPMSRRLHRLAAALRAPKPWIARNVDLAEPLPESADIVVSTGPSTAATNIAVARAIGARNIYCGFPKRPQLGVTALLTPVPTKARCAVFAPRPTDIDAATLRRPVPLREPGPHRIALLMGGDSKHYAYTERDMLTLARALGEILAGEPEWTLVAYDSRRTSTKLFETFADALGDVGGRVKIVRYAEAGLASNAGAFECDLILVTADSLSMVTEAVASARPTLVIAPDLYTGPRRDMNEIEALRAQRLVARACFGELSARALQTPPSPPAQSRPAALSALLRARGL
ncbi:ELM1/GtrOC1 family putative glycosyltransferase [Acuticoccus sp. I52.16.1]|uniref:ELM1/GtrOC1 family putative glycosyltransferase n=1 Tax=Acuticoccus sp. I52.16.1 TaxID=2928472 RepID=UPI001FD33F89|nr:ELM1/GtrOC1 family putative glycosyltransferase [Acuticoccus sp. I52.16.1]UOM36993.1 mitochondrial fission ELM1 family protein [Acuticoccus sp. I52.16.1]